MSKNVYLQQLVEELKKASKQNGADIWKRVALDLEKPTRNRRIVNLSKLSRYTQDNEVVVVPGKVLGSGDIDKKITIAAYQFSDQAIEKITKAKGQVMKINELVKKNPKGKEVKIIG